MIGTDRRVQNEMRTKRDPKSIEGIYKPPKDIRRTAYIKNMEEFKRIYYHSIRNPSNFWAEEAEKLHWSRMTLYRKMTKYDISTSQ